MSIKIKINQAALRSLERQISQNIKRQAQKVLPRNAVVDTKDVEKIAKDATKELEKALRRI